MKAEPTLNQDITAIIHKTGEDWARYWNARQAEKLAELYAEDAVYLPPTTLPFMDGRPFANI